MKKNKDTNISNVLFTLGIATLFLGGFLLLVVFGATSYRNIVDSQDDNNHTRELMSFLSTTLSANKYNEIYTYSDAAVDSKVLVIVDDDGTHAVRIYNYDNNLVADYGSKDGQLWPQDANIIGNNSVFKIRQIHNELLEIETDLGKVYANVNRYRGEQ